MGWFARFLEWFSPRPGLSMYKSQVQPIEAFSERDLFVLHNVERSKRMVAPLELDAKLSALATSRAALAADANLTRDHLHDGLQAVPGFRKTAENADIGPANADQAMESWMESPDHRANILDPGLKKMGAGRAISQNLVTYYYVVFTGWWFDV